MMAMSFSVMTLVVDVDDCRHYHSMTSMLRLWLLVRRSALVVMVEGMVVGEFEEQVMVVWASVHKTVHKEDVDVDVDVGVDTRKYSYSYWYDLARTEVVMDGKARALDSVMVGIDYG